MTSKKKEPEQAIFYQNFKGAIYSGTPTQVKNLMVAFCEYAFDHIESPQITPDIAMPFSMMKSCIDADRKHYSDVCEQNRLNGLKRSGVTITGFICECRYTENTVTVLLDDGEEYCIDRKDEKVNINEITAGEFVEIDIKGGKAIAIRLAQNI